MSEDSSEVWIGLIEVRPKPGCLLLGGARGAYTHALAWAPNEAEYLDLVRKALSEVKLEYVTSEDVQPLLMRRLDDEVTKDVLECADEVRETREVRLTPFHIWKE